MSLPRPLPALALAAAALLGAAPASAQGNGVLKGGLGRSTLRGDDAGEPDWRQGFVVGGGTTLGAGARQLQWEILYARRGAAPLPGGDPTFVLDYLQVPVVGRLNLGNPRSGLRPYVLIGPSIAFRVRCRTATLPASGGEEQLADCPEETVSGTDVTVLGGLGFELGRGRTGLVVEGRYDYGFGNVSAVPDTKVRNEYFTVLVGLRY